MGNRKDGHLLIRKKIVVAGLAFVFACISMALGIFMASKQQLRPDSIIEKNGEIWFGRIKSIQVDEFGNLYVALDNHNIIKCIGEERTVFYFGYEARSSYQFTIKQNVIYIEYGDFIYQYDLQGTLLSRNDTSRSLDVVMQDCESVTYQDKEYRIERHCLLEEVWQYDAGEAQLCYRRLAWPLAWQMVLSSGVVAVSLLVVLKDMKRNKQKNPSNWLNRLRHKGTG